MRSTLLSAIRFYRKWISPAFPGSCRFTPTCSAYAIQAIERHGSLKGAALTAGRLARCHPFHPGGWDPVPTVSECGGNGETGSKLDGLAKSSSTRPARGAQINDKPRLGEAPGSMYSRARGGRPD